MSDAGDRVASLRFAPKIELRQHAVIDICCSSEFTNSSVATTNFEDDFGKYASPYLISHLTTTAL